LTLFEEYRGFMENAKHIRLDPKTKDLFIVDKLGGRSKDGIALVRNLTGYAVHDELIPNVEADAQGVVNRNAALFAGLKPTTKWATIIEKSQNGGPGSSGLTGGPKPYIWECGAGISGDRTRGLEHCRPGAHPDRPLCFSLGA